MLHQRDQHASPNNASEQLGAYDQFWIAFEDPPPATINLKQEIKINAYEQFAAAIDA